MIEVLDKLVAKTKQTSINTKYLRVLLFAFRQSITVYLLQKNYIHSILRDQVEKKIIKRI